VGFGATVPSLDSYLYAPVGTDAGPDRGTSSIYLGNDEFHTLAAGTGLDWEKGGVWPYENKLIDKQFTN